MYINIKYTNKYILCRNKTMTQLEMIKMLDFLESNSVWTFDISFVCAYFKTSHRQNIKIVLSRFVKNGLIERIARNLYANPRAKSRPYYILEHIASTLRHKTTTYLSLESVLSEEGLISQMPNRLIFISKNRSQIFRTPYGIIEFVYTKTKLEDLHKDCYYDKKRGIYIANTQKAISDIYRHNRSIDLYEEQLIKGV
ncbi:type IV toxin-antitoxin system AbiEi family antitoxin [Helicobacter sp. MIT 14-3879]|uniref:type IV toxin-antitoxin system AbiEi family antitoxin n=1 Tax=Helicobacter sp. MIT 14-3879 TaxID=2040649 RepID=UPI000E1E39D4|nr:hypothetical protein [Helicobacter sp. MIT 14-3879]RDU61493.1 hypothetical protein CQA44_08780 [Helicobacter sp. MIT 14-3879]